MNTEWINEPRQPRRQLLHQIQGVGESRSLRSNESDRATRFAGSDRGSTWCSLSRRVFATLLVAMASGCASVRLDVPRALSFATQDSERTTLGRQLSAISAQHPGRSGFKVMASGSLAFGTRAALADAAERTLDLQYYSVGDGLTTDLLLLRIVDAAERGVRVRILLDDIYAPTRRFARRAAAAHPAIQVRLFNPFLSSSPSSLVRLGEFAVDGERLNRRMHNKLWVADNTAGVIGSRNLGDEYFDAQSSGNFSDVDLLAVGPIVRELSRAFDAYWNSASAIPLAAFVDDLDAAEGALVRKMLRERAAGCAALPPCQRLAQNHLQGHPQTVESELIWGTAQLTYDQPDQEKISAASGLEHGLIEDDPRGSRTQSELLIVTPYFIPSVDGLLHLKEMRSRGVRVAVLTNSLASTDSPAAHAGYARHRQALLRDGVELFEMRPQPGARHGVSHRWGPASPDSLHAKLIVQDRTRSIVGSLNQDPRSRLHNTEAWIAIDSVELATELAALFDEGVDEHHSFGVHLRGTGSEITLNWHSEENGVAVIHDVEPMASWWLRLWRGVLGMTLPEHML